MCVPRTALALVLVVSFLVSGCGTAEPTVTPLSVTATRVAVVATNTPLPPTSTPMPPTPTDTPNPPTETATPSPTATPTPTATATSTPSPTPAPTDRPVLTLYPEPGIRADARTYGGRHSDWASDVLLLDDGGTLVVGRANNTHLSHRVMPGNARVIRTDAAGNIVWQNDYGGEADGRLYSAIQTDEDEYVIVGHIAASYERDETDMYLVKIDGEGNEIWSHTYGGRGLEAEGMVRQTADGGYILAGDRADEFPTDGLYRSKLILIKTDAEGNEVWSRTYGSKKLYLAFGVAQTPDGGYVLTGWEAKTYPDRDVIVIKTDENGEVDWSRKWDLDPGERDGAFDLILATDGHVVVACIQSMNKGPRRAVLVKVDLDGNEIWVKEYGEKGVGSEFWDIMEDADGGYVMAGAAITGRKPATGEDIRRPWVIKTDTDGEVLWQHVFDVDEFETASLSSAAVLPDDGYVFVGQATRSGEKHWDMLWLKMAPEASPVPPAGADAPALEAISVDTVDQVERLSTLNGHSDRIYALAYSGDGSHIASAGPDKTVRLWDVASGQEVHTFSIPEVSFNNIALSQDGRLLAAPQAIWDVESGQVIHTLNRITAPIAFSPDVSILALAHPEQPVKLLDVTTGQVAHTLESQTYEVAHDTDFSPDGTRLAVAGHKRDGTAFCGVVALWELEGGQFVPSLVHILQDCVHSIAFSPDGQLLASAGTEGKTVMWDVASGQELLSLQGNSCYDVAFSPDGSLLATSGCDHTVKLWEVPGGRLVRTLPHGGEVVSVVFSPDGTLLATGGYDNQVYVWGIPR